MFTALISGLALVALLFTPLLVAEALAAHDHGEPRPHPAPHVGGETTGTRPVRRAA